MTINLEGNFGVTEANAFFKTKYDPYFESVMNTATITLSQITKNSKMGAKGLTRALRIGFSGSVGSGRLPHANVGNYANLTTLPQKHYGRLIVERLAMVAAQKSEEAFGDAMKEPIESTTTSFHRNLSRQIFGNDETRAGVIGTVSSISAVGGGVYDLTISAATWKEANWEEKDFVSIGTGTSWLYEVTAVTPSTRIIRVQGQNGAPAPTGTPNVYMQLSENAESVGLKVLKKTSGTFLGSTIDRRNSGTYISLSSEALTPDRLNQLALRIEKKCGQSPTMAPTSYEQYEVLLNQLEDQKRYQMTKISPAMKELKGVISYEGLQFLASSGPIKIFPERFVDPDSFYMLNEKHLELDRTPQTGWATEDGTVYLRVLDEDNYEARYVMYGELFLNLAYHGVIDGATFLS